MRARRGFTMIELAISVGMATLVVLGMYGIFTIQTQQLMNQDMRMEMHQNGRFALADPFARFEWQIWFSRQYRWCYGRWRRR